MSVSLFSTALLDEHWISHLSCRVIAMVKFSDLPLKQIFGWKKRFDFFLPRDWARDVPHTAERGVSFGDKLQQVTKHKANLKLVILIFQVEILTEHHNPTRSRRLNKMNAETHWKQRGGWCWHW